MPDPIEKSIQLRIKEGSNTSVVPNYEKKGTEIAISKLKLVGEIPKAAEIKRDPTMKPPKEI